MPADSLRAGLIIVNGEEFKVQGFIIDREEKVEKLKDLLYARERHQESKELTLSVKAKKEKNIH